MIPETLILQDERPSFDGRSHVQHFGLGLGLGFTSDFWRPVLKTKRWCITTAPFSGGVTISLQSTIAAVVYAVIS